MNDGSIKIGVDLDTTNLEKGLNNVAKDNRKTFEQISKDTGKSVEDIKKEVKKLAEEYQKQGMNIPLSYKKAYKELGILAKKNADEVSEQAEKISDSYEKSGNKVSKSFGGLGKGIGSLGGSLSIVTTGIKAFAGATTAAVGGLAALGVATAEYRDEQAKLNSAFQNAGYSTEVAQEAYQQFYAILGEEDTAVEASQLLAKLSLNQQDMSKWTEIATGVWATYGDALPIEGLIESANETAKVGKVTGSLADALNWAGISEDEFNAQLAVASSEAERNQLIMSTLSGEYQNAANIFKENNATIMEARKAQSQLMESLGGLGEAVNNVSNQLLVGFAPAITGILEAFTNLINGVEGAEEQLATAISNLVNKAVEQLPQFLEFGGQILIALVNGIVQSLPQLGEAALNIIIGLQEKIIENLPTFINTASDILQGLAKGITENLPIILKNSNEILMQLVNGIIENLPLIVDTGIDIILALVDSLIDSLPELIPAAVEAIIIIAESLMENLDKIIDAAIELILALADGLIDALPILVEKIPVIISKLVFELTKPETLIKLLDAGVQLVLGLIEGIFKMNAALLQAGVDIVKDIATSIMNSPGEIIEAGKDLIRGLLDGIKSMAGEVYNTMKNFTTGIINDVKSFFGIHSPSRVFRDEIGVWLPLGMSEGITSKAKEVIKAIIKPIKEAEEEIKKEKNVLSKNLANTITEATKKATKEAKNFGETGEILITSLTDNIDNNKENAINSMDTLIKDMLKSSNETIDAESKTLIENYTNTINEQIKNETLSKEAGKKLIKDYTDSVKSTASEEKESIKAVGTEMMSSFKESLETGANQANQIIEEKLGTLSQTFQNEMDSLISAQENLQSKLGDAKLFEFEDNELIIQDLDETINKLNEYDTAIAQLKEKGISDAILDELAGYSVDEVLKISETLLKMTDEEFAILNKKWAEKQATAATVASNFYKEQMAILEKDFNDELIKVLDELPDQVEDIGIMTITGFEEGLSSKFDSIREEARSFADSIVSEMQRALDIHSPSRKMMWLGKMTMDGYEKGVTDNAKFSLKAISDIPIFDTFKEQVAKTKVAVNMGVNSMIPKSSYVTNNTSNSRVNNTYQGDLIFNVSGMTIRSDNDIKAIAQELYILQNTRNLAKGGV